MNVFEELLVGTRFAESATLAWLRLTAFRSPLARRSYQYKRLIISTIERVLEPHSCAVDVGCHRGLFLGPILRSAPHGQHIAIEPLPFLAELLKRRFPTVDVRAVAVGDHVGTTPFYVNHKEPGYSSVVNWKQGPTAADQVEVQQVPISTLDELLPKERPIRLLRMDGMGTHVAMLRGARNTIRANRPFIIFWARHLATEDPAPAAIDTWQLLVEDCGLRISRLADWSARRPPLSAIEFQRSVGHHEDAERCLLAHP
jgi:FkbM family methyltransferase